MVAMSLLSITSTACQSPSACMIARSSAYAYFLEMVVGKSEMLMLKRRGARTDHCGTPFLRRRNLLRLPFPVVRLKLRKLPLNRLHDHASLHQLRGDGVCRDWAQVRRASRPGSEFADRVPHLWPVREKPMELRTSSHRSSLFCSSQDSRTKRLCQSQSPLELGGRCNERSRSLCPNMAHSFCDGHVV